MTRRGPPNCQKPGCERDATAASGWTRCGEHSESARARDRALGYAVLTFGLAALASLTPGAASVVVGALGAAVGVTGVVDVEFRERTKSLPGDARALMRADSFALLFGGVTLIGAAFLAGAGVGLDAAILLIAGTAFVLAVTAAVSFALIQRGDL